MFILPLDLDPGLEEPLDPGLENPLDPGVEDPLAPRLEDCRVTPGPGRPD